MNKDEFFLGQKGKYSLKLRKTNEQGQNITGTRFTARLSSKIEPLFEKQPTDANGEINVITNKEINSTNGRDIYIIKEDTINYYLRFMENCI